MCSKMFVLQDPQVCSPRLQDAQVCALKCQLCALRCQVCALRYQVCTLGCESMYVRMRKYALKSLEVDE